MPTICFGTHPFDADLILFDKDGTLIAFAPLWGAKTVGGVEALVAALDAPARAALIRADLYRTLGYDLAAGRFAPHSPVLTASMGALYTVAATVLYQHGWGWLAAELLVEHHFAPGMAAAFDPARIIPLADLRALCAGLRAAGVQTAVLTADDTAPALRTLALLGIEETFALVLGADRGYPAKPNPAAALAICDRLGVDPAHTVMVGDSTTDMLMAQRAGLGLRVAVSSGLMTQAQLAPTADLVLAHVGEIRTGCTGTQSIG